MPEYTPSAPLRTLPPSHSPGPDRRRRTRDVLPEILDVGIGDSASTDSAIREKSPLGKAIGSRPEFKRVDWVWDSKLYSYKLQDTSEIGLDTVHGYIFHVRRIFDPENKYRHTVVDIKSKLLRECLQDVIGDVRESASLMKYRDSIRIFCFCKFPCPFKSCHLISFLLC